MSQEELVKSLEGATKLMLTTQNNQNGYFINQAKQ